MDAPAPSGSAPALLGRFGRGVAAAARTVHRRRALLWAFAARAIFWGALLLWCSTAMTLVGGGTLDVDAMFARFVFGAAICALVALAAAVARLRWLGALVGALHGLGGLTLWLLA